MVRQPYSAAVKSDGEERLHPLSPEGKGCANERNESPLSHCRVQPALSKKEGELQKDSVWAKFAYTASDGKTY